MVECKDAERGIMAKKRITLPENFQELLNAGDVEELKKVFIHCDVNAKKGRYGSNALAMTPLPQEFALWLVKQGADVNKKDYYGKTPIFQHASAYNGDVRLLISLGADIKATTGDDTTPLHLAALYGRVDAVQELIENGAEVNAKIRDRLFSEHNYTPLEITLVQDRVSKPVLLSVCEILLKNGAQITEKSRDAVTKIGEKFEFYKASITDEEFLIQSSNAMHRLYEIFGVTPVKEIEIHDGVSPIIVNENGFVNQYNKMWEYLVPPRGIARTAQGEVIRITGKVAHEIMDNGGMNWNKDFQSMLDVLPRYFRMGNALPEQDILQAEKLIEIIYHGNGDDEPEKLTAYAVAWVLANQEVISVIPPVYNR